jgi:hypothetical protein
MYLAFKKRIIKFNLSSQILLEAISFLVSRSSSFLECSTAFEIKLLIWRHTIYWISINDKCKMCISVSVFNKQGAKNIYSALYAFRKKKGGKYNFLRAKYKEKDNMYMLIHK